MAGFQYSYISLLNQPVLLILFLCVRTAHAEAPSLGPKARPNYRDPCFTQGLRRNEVYPLEACLAVLDAKVKHMVIDATHRDIMRKRLIQIHSDNRPVH
ncbi:hypothetical protein KIPB_007464 [Kipferlia bialata]|uniref:Uncharacterized protein n=1 Tax=Kipferlia bialata TaxID=797122 RepID=A0A9K3CYL5_9EUKA|nr:hypothetical protein KIPB_007464 [Kipferlia bialata]|eukprot:g7464.t1